MQNRDKKNKNPQATPATSPTPAVPAVPGLPGRKQGEPERHTYPLSDLLERHGIRLPRLKRVIADRLRIRGVDLKQLDSDYYLKPSDVALAESEVACDALLLREGKLPRKNPEQVAEDFDVNADAEDGDEGELEDDDLADPDEDPDEDEDE